MTAFSFSVASIIFDIGLVILIVSVAILIQESRRS